MDGKKYATTNQQRVEEPVLINMKQSRIQNQDVTREKEGHFMMVKGSSYQEKQ